MHRDFAAVFLPTRAIDPAVGERFGEPSELTNKTGNTGMWNVIMFHGLAQMPRDYPSFN